MLPLSPRRQGNSCLIPEWVGMLAAPPPPHLCAYPPESHEAISCLCTFWKNFLLCIFLLTPEFLSVGELWHQYKKEESNPLPTFSLH